VPFTFFLEDILERRKDMLDKVFIIPHIPPPATKIIKNYSKFQKRGFRHGFTQIFSHRGTEDGRQMTDERRETQDKIAQLSNACPEQAQRVEGFKCSTSCHGEALNRFWFRAKPGLAQRVAESKIG
jgi:hypothetical protein